MRLLFVSNLFPPGISGGFEIECRQVADALASRGHQLCILTTPWGCPTPIKEEVDYPVYRTLQLFYPFEQPISSALRLKKWWIGKHNFRATREAIEAFHPDLLFIWSPLRIGISSARAAISANIPYSWRIGDETLASYVSSPFLPTPQGLYRWLSDHFLFPNNTLEGLSFDRTSLISSTTKERLSAKGINLSKAEVAYKGIPVECFPAKEHPGSLSDPARLLYVGRLHPQKGVHTIIEAVKKLAKSDAIELTIVGTGSADYVAQLKQMADGCNLPINFLGFIPYELLSAVYREHQIFIFPSNSLEAQGATYLEAMCSGLAVIGTAGGGQGEILRDGENALTFPEGDADALSEQLHRLLKDDQLRTGIACQGCREVRERYSFNEYVNKIEHFIQGTRVVDPKQYNRI
jgi:glycogen synthase